MDINYMVITRVGIAVSQSLIKKQEVPCEVCSAACGLFNIWTFNLVIAHPLRKSGPRSAVV